MTTHTQHSHETPHNDQSVASVMDSLPYTRQHRKVVVGSGIGWSLDAMDVGLISFVMVALAQQWGLTPTQSGWLSSAGMIGMTLGAFLGGILADRIGRKKVFTYSLVLFGVASGLSALAMGLGVFLLLRFIVGLGMGAELPVASTLVSEIAPEKLRGRLVVFLEGFWTVGWLLAAIIGYLIVPLENGWRWALLIGVLPALYGAYVRKSIPESPKYYAGQGESEKAQATLKSFTQSEALDSVLVRGVSEGAGDSTQEWQEDASRKLTINKWAARVLWFSISFAYYGCFIWLPSLLVEQGFTMQKSFGYTLVITLAQFPGYIVAGWLIEVWGRKRTMLMFLVLALVGALCFGIATNIPGILLSGMLLSFSCLGAWGVLYAYIPELFPTQKRATQVGIASAWGRVASILAPLCVGALVSAGMGMPVIFGMFALAFVIAAVATALLPETLGTRWVEDSTLEV